MRRSLAIPEWDKARILNEVFDRVANGDTLTHICKSHGMPSADKIRRWIAEDPLMREEYRLAREMAADTYQEMMLDIVSKPMRDRLSLDTAKLQIETLEKLAKMIAPNRYGPRVDMEKEKAQSNAPKVIIEFIDPDINPDDGIDAE